MAHPIPVKGAEAMRMIRMGEAPEGTQVSMPITPAPGPLGYEEGRMFTTGAEPTAPSAPVAAPQAQEGGPGGWIQFGPGTEKIPLPRGESQVAPDRNQILQQVRANPISFISRLEVKMGQQGLPEGTRMGYRHALARLMGEAGVDPGAALLYAQGGAQALPQVASLLSRQAMARAEEVGQMQRFQMGLMARGQRPIPASTQRFMYDVGMAQAKAEKKRAVIIIFPNGEIHTRSVNKPGWKIIPTELLYTKRGSITYAERAYREHISKGTALPENIAVINLSSGMEGMGAPPSMPMAPTTPLESQFNEQEYQGTINILQNRKGR
jgi:hypothetical protein